MMSRHRARLVGGPCTAGGLIECADVFAHLHVCYSMHASSPLLDFHTYTYEPHPVPAEIPRLSKSMLMYGNSGSSPDLSFIYNMVMSVDLQAAGSSCWGFCTEGQGGMHT